MHARLSVQSFSLSLSPVALSLSSSVSFRALYIMQSLVQKTPVFQSQKCVWHMLTHTHMHTCMCNHMYTRAGTGCATVNCCNFPFERAPSDVYRGFCHVQPTYSFCLFSRTARGKRLSWGKRRISHTLTCALSLTLLLFMFGNSDGNLECTLPVGIGVHYL